MLLLPYAHARLSSDLPKLLLALKQLVVRLADHNDETAHGVAHGAAHGVAHGAAAAAPLSGAALSSRLLRSTAELFGAVYALFPSHTVSFLRMSAECDARILAVATRLLVTINLSGATSSNLVLHPGIIDPNGASGRFQKREQLACARCTLLGSSRARVHA